ncbi:expressed unknown protein [Seminavis robusta]|uniref:Uncharacterized protein n=1 Tax=Seminavis robusta TaxID=568900 RepID=A0A9N8DYB5_9STRA|nr:expressed unknown protein [Seminavis robusta]|eukprot:Sro443_g144040.1 n/a (785) ;mRNA; f:28280-30724
MSVRVAQGSHALDSHNDAKSISSYRSTHTTRSSVLERAREYNRRIDEQKHRRSKSLERDSDVPDNASSASGATPRSQSAGRMSSSQVAQGNRPSTRERAMASVQRESMGSNNAARNHDAHPQHQAENRSSSHHTRASSTSHQRESPGGNEAAQPTPRSRSSAGSYSSHMSRPKPTTPRIANGSSSHHNSNNHHHNQNNNSAGHNAHYQEKTRSHGNHHPNQQTRHSHPRVSTDQPYTSKDPPVQSARSSQMGRSADSNRMSHPEPKEENHEAVVTPELLVDALSGHEDGLLAIAERLMEHYDSGYDVMGEAIIDAFADVQKLFQHVVEAAHMEGAAFEASRREEEISELRKQASAAGELNPQEDSLQNGGQNQNGTGGPTRHDEFIDQDVKDILNEAIRKGTNYRNSGKYTECYHLYEQACQSASSLLPVDSDHRGRLQLSIARAESMSHERACAILRYAMDDVLRSGLRAGNVPLPDPSQRADVVLNKPRGHPTATGATGQGGVVQSSEEALNSLVEEMREVLSAPVYNNTPIQNVAQRFLAALADAQKSQQKNEEKLEQNLAKLKGDFLLARAEWEEKLNSTQETADIFKEKYSKLKDSVRQNSADGSGSTYLDHARSALASQQQRVNSEEETETYGFSTIRSTVSRAGSHASLGSGLANHARSIVGSFSCAGGNVRSGGVIAQELAENRDAEIREMAFRHDSGKRDRDRRRSSNGDKRNAHSISMSYSDRSVTASEAQSQSTGGQQQQNRRTPHSVASGSTRSKSSRSFREYSRSPQRVDF